MLNIANRKSNGSGEYRPYLKMKIQDAEGEIRDVIMNQNAFLRTSGFPEEKLKCTEERKRKKVKKKLLRYFDGLKNPGCNFYLRPYRTQVNPEIRFSCIKFV